MEDSKILALVVYKTLTSNNGDRILVICNEPDKLEKTYRKFCQESKIKIPEIFFLPCEEGNKLRGYRGNVVLVEGNSNNVTKKMKEYILPLISVRFNSAEVCWVRQNLGHFSESWGRKQEVVFSDD